jgi:hypothetical protein
MTVRVERAAASRCRRLLATVREDCVVGKKEADK